MDTGCTLAPGHPAEMCYACKVQSRFQRVLSLSVVQLFVTPWTVAHQAPLSMGFFRQEYWSGLLFPSSGDLSNPGIKSVSPELAGGFFTC